MHIGQLYLNYLFINEANDFLQSLKWVKSPYAYSELLSVKLIPGIIIFEIVVISLPARRLVT